MASKAELKGRVSLNSKAFQSKMRRLRRTARKWGAAMTRAASMAAKGMAIATAAVTASALGIFKLTKQTADAGDKMQKMALRTGLSVDALERLDYISQITGSSVDNIQKGMKQLARSISYAKDGLTTYTREFDKMGLSMADLEGLTPEQAFDKVAKAVSKMNDPLQQAATAATLFGRSGQMMLPMLKSGEAGMAKLRKRFEEIGFAFRKEGADAAAAFNDKLTDLKTAIAGVRNKLVLAFIDNFSGGIETLIQKVVEFRKQGKFAEWAATAAGAVNNFVETSRVLFSNFKIYGKAAWNILKTEGMILWDSLVLAAKGSVLATAKLINTGVAKIKEAWVVLKTSGQVVWNLVKESALLAWRGMQVGAIKAFAGIMKTSEKSINAIIAGLNKIPRINIKPVNFESIDKAEGKIKELEGKISEGVEAMKISGDAWKPLAEGAKKLKEIKAETRAINDELDKDFAGKNGERINRLEKNTKAIADGTILQEAHNKSVEKEAEIRKDGAAIRQKIAGWQQAAAKAERERAKAAGDTTGELGEQENIMKRMTGGKKAKWLTRAFEGITRLGRGEPSSAMVRRNEGKASARDRKLEEEQLKVQQRIADNTGRKQEAMAW